VERGKLPLEEAGANEVGVLHVALVVVDERRRKEPVERRLPGVERLAQLRRQRCEDIPLLRGKPHPVRPVPSPIDAAAHR